jgi:hypothetical protein
MQRASWVVVAGLGLATGLGCSPRTPASGDSTRSVGAVITRTPRDTSAPSAPDTVLPRLVRLEQEARALAKTQGCSGVDACRTAPVGWRGCGGPRSYVVYCAATTDTVALMRKLKELEDAERAYNASSGMMSTCELRMPPGVRLDGGRCRESRSGAGGGAPSLPD